MTKKKSILPGIVHKYMLFTSCNYKAINLRVAELPDNPRIKSLLSWNNGY